MSGPPFMPDSKVKVGSRWYKVGAVMSLVGERYYQLIDLAKGDVAMFPATLVEQKPTSKSEAAHK